MPRRRGNELFRIESEILDAAHRFALSGRTEFHGYQLTQEIRGVGADHRRIGHGTIYRALDRLEERRLLEGSWEDPAISEQLGRPRRYLYRLTALGVASRAASRDGSVSEPSAVLNPRRVAEGLM